MTFQLIPTFLFSLAGIAYLLFFFPMVFPAQYNRCIRWATARNWRRYDRTASQLGVGFLVLASFFLVAIVFHAYYSGAMDRLVNQ